MKTEIFYSELIALEGRLTRFAHTFTSNVEDVKDLVQETYLKALLFKEQFKDNTNLSAWTFTIMRNIFINEYRRNIKQLRPLDSMIDRLLINSAPNRITSESSYLIYEILKTIDSLDEELRTPFLPYMLGYKYKEIGEMLNLKLSTVKSRIFYARKILTQSLRHYKEN